MTIHAIHIGIMHNEHGLAVWLTSLVVSTTLTVFFLMWREARNAEPAPDNSLSKYKLYFEKLPSEERMVAMFKERAKERRVKMLEKAKALEQLREDVYRLFVIVLISEAKHPTFLQGAQLRLV